MNVFTSIHGYKILAATVLMLMLTLGWTDAAHAASPFGAQYGSPTAPVSSIAGGGGSGSGGSESLLVSGGSAAGTADASSGTSAVIGLLPDTGGSLFVTALLGIALVGTGLLLLRRADSR